MFGAIGRVHFYSAGDSAVFIEKRERLPLALLRNMSLRRLYVIRIDKLVWAEVDALCGKIHCRKRRCHTAFMKSPLHVPPFVPHRVVGERVFAGADYEKTVAAAPLHIEIPSKLALQRRIEDIDKDAAFLWFSGESEAQKRGAVMVYLPVTSNPTARRREGFRSSGAFYMGSQTMKSAVR